MLITARRAERLQASVVIGSNLKVETIVAVHSIHPGGSGGGGGGTWALGGEHPSSLHGIGCYYVIWHQRDASF